MRKKTMTRTRNQMARSHLFLIFTIGRMNPMNPQLNQNQDPSDLHAALKRLQIPLYHLPIPHPQVQVPPQIQSPPNFILAVGRWPIRVVGPVTIVTLRSLVIGANWRGSTIVMLVHFIIRGISVTDLGKIWVTSQLKGEIVNPNIHRVIKGVCIRHVCNKVINK